MLNTLREITRALFGEDRLTSESWIEIIYKQMIRYSEEPLNDVDEHELMQQSTDLLLPGEPNFGKDLKILRLFSELYHANAPISLINQIAQEVSDERYHAVTKQLLSIEIIDLEGFKFPIFNTIMLNQRITLIKNLPHLKRQMSTKEKTRAFKRALNDWIFQLTSLFLQHLHLLSIQKDFYHLSTYSDESVYLSAADEVYRLASIFDEVQRANLYERLELYYEAMTLNYNKLTSESADLRVEDFSWKGDPSSNFMEQLETALANVKTVYQREYMHILHTSRLAFIRSLNHKDTQSAYQPFYKTLLAKHHKLKKILSDPYEQVKASLEQLPPADEEMSTSCYAWEYFEPEEETPLVWLQDCLAALESLDQQCNMKTLLDACFALNKEGKNSLIMNQDKFIKTFNIPLEKERVISYAPEFFTEPVVSSQKSPHILSYIVSL